MKQFERLFLLVELVLCLVIFVRGIDKTAECPKSGTCYPQNCDIGDNCTMRVCTGRIVTIKCRTGVMNVKSFFFGRTDLTVCAIPQMQLPCSPDEALAEQQLSNAKRLCNNEKECKLQASYSAKDACGTNTWGDACPNKSKYIVINYDCLDEDPIKYFTEWTSWGTCSKSCGLGEQTRDRSCTDPPNKECTTSTCKYKKYGNETDRQTCNEVTCPVSSSSPLVSSSSSIAASSSKISMSSSLLEKSSSISSSSQMTSSSAVASSSIAAAPSSQAVTFSSSSLLGSSSPAFSSSQMVSLSSLSSSTSSKIATSSTSILPKSSSTVLFSSQKESSSQIQQVSSSSLIESSSPILPSSRMTSTSMTSLSSSSSSSLPQSTSSTSSSIGTTSSPLSSSSQMTPYLSSSLFEHSSAVVQSSSQFVSSSQLLNATSSKSILQSYSKSTSIEILPSSQDMSSYTKSTLSPIYNSTQSIVTAYSSSKKSTSLILPPIYSTKMTDSTAVTSNTTSKYTSKISIQSTPSLSMTSSSFLTNRSSSISSSSTNTTGMKSTFASYTTVIPSSLSSSMSSISRLNKTMIVNTELFTTPLESKQMQTTRGRYSSKSLQNSSYTSVSMVSSSSVKGTNKTVILPPIVTSYSTKMIDSTVVTSNITSKYTSRIAIKPTPSLSMTSSSFLTNSSASIIPPTKSPTTTIKPTEQPTFYANVTLTMIWKDFCKHSQEFRDNLARLLTTRIQEETKSDQVILLNLGNCATNPNEAAIVRFYIGVKSTKEPDRDLTRTAVEILTDLISGGTTSKLGSNFVNGTLTGVVFVVVPHHGDDDHDDWPVWLIILVVIAAIIFILWLCCCAWIFCGRRKEKKYPKRKYTFQHIHSNEIPHVKVTDDDDDDEPKYTSSIKVTVRPKSPQQFDNPAYELDTLPIGSPGDKIDNSPSTFRPINVTLIPSNKPVSNNESKPDDSSNSSSDDDNSGDDSDNYDKVDTPPSGDTTKVYMDGVLVEEIPNMELGSKAITLTAPIGIDISDDEKATEL